MSTAAQPIFDPDAFHQQFTQAGGFDPDKFHQEFTGNAAGDYQTKKGAPVQNVNDPGIDTSSGHRVVVPQPGEDFTDTLKRGAAMGRTVSPGEIKESVAGAKRQVPAVLGAATVAGPALIGAGALAPAVASEAAGGGILGATAGGATAGAGQDLLSKGLHGAAGENPFTLEGAKDFGESTAAGAGAGLGLGLLGEGYNAVKPQTPGLFRGVTRDIASKYVSPRLADAILPEPPAEVGSAYLPSTQDFENNSAKLAAKAKTEALAAGRLAPGPWKPGIKPPAEVASPFGQGATFSNSPNLPPAGGLQGTPTPFAQQPEIKFVSQFDKPEIPSVGGPLDESGNSQDLISRMKTVVQPGAEPTAADLKRAGDMTQAPIERLKTLAKFGDKLAQNEINRRLVNP